MFSEQQGVNTAPRQASSYVCLNNGNANIKAKVWLDKIPAGTANPTKAVKFKDNL